MCTCALLRMFSSIKWPSEPEPEVAQRKASGCCLARAKRALKSPWARAGVAAISTGEYITLATGVRSFVAS